MGLSLAARPTSAGMLARWREYMIAREGPLSPAERRVVRRTVAGSLCDGATFDDLADAAPRSPRDVRLATYAEALTVAPWRIGRADLDAVRAEGLDDHALLDLITLVAFQNLDSRLRLVLTEWSASP
jgi:alkylhydroperoxidase family enzyme